MPKSADLFHLDKTTGGISIAFDTTKIELAPIRNGQFLKLKAELDGINGTIQELAREDIEAAQEVVAYNTEHEGEEGFEPKDFTPTTVQIAEYYGPWLKSVVSELGVTNGHLPESVDDWPLWLTRPDSLTAIVEHWQFNPLDRGGE